ncbi:MAG: hypothetical protein VKJ02_13600 [Snowella sp.]|nr:hypothetical protein [Snowella sp.]
MTTQAEIIRYPQLPLAIYREVAAHLQQIQGVKAELTPQTSKQFDYFQSQIESVRIEYPAELPHQDKQYLESILNHYAQKYGNYQRKLA